MTGKDKGPSQAEVIRTLLAQVERKLTAAETKVTLADYIRLVQLKKELEEDEPRDIRVTWLEGTGDEGGSSED